MNIKQLFLISFLCIFPLQAMEEVKVASEQKENQEISEIKNANEFKELNKYVPNTIKFLFSVLRPKDPNKYKHLPKILQQGLPDGIIRNIILYLKTDTFKQDDASRRFYNEIYNQTTEANLDVPFSLYQAIEGIPQVSYKIEQVNDCPFTNDNTIRLQIFTALKDGRRGWIGSFVKAKTPDLDINKSKSTSLISQYKIQIREYGFNNFMLDLAAIGTFIYAAYAAKIGYQYAKKFLGK